mgnify:CR=1 FL=1
MPTSLLKSSNFEVWQTLLLTRLGFKGFETLLTHNHRLYIALSHVVFALRQPCWWKSCLWSRMTNLTPQRAPLYIVDLAGCQAQGFDSCMPTTAINVDVSMKPKTRRISSSAMTKSVAAKLPNLNLSKIWQSVVAEWIVLISKSPGNEVRTNEV